MDSPRLRSERARYNEDGQNDPAALTSLQCWVRSIQPLHKVLSVLVVSSVLTALGFSSLPLSRPMGALVLRKLWDVLRFLVLTTSIGLGILNSRPWRRTYTDSDDSVTSNSGKEDSFSSKVPFAGMFYDEVRHSYSFSGVAQDKLPSSEKAAPSTAFNVAVHVKKKGTERSAAHQAEPSNIDAGIPGATSKHSRSQSAYNFNELLVQQHLKSKPSISSPLPKRRNVSLSFDLSCMHTSLPSPPEPPLIYGYDTVENKVASADVADSKQVESSRRKAFTESLAPWRAATNTVPVNIPTFTHKEATQIIKDPSTNTMKMSATEKGTASSSPSTPNTMGSPSRRELNKKFDAYIAGVRERMRLQRLESLERSKQRGH